MDTDFCGWQCLDYGELTELPRLGLLYPLIVAAEYPEAERGYSGRDVVVGTFTGPGIYSVHAHNCIVPCRTVQLASMPGVGGRLVGRPTGVRTKIRRM
jgi:hypothetical protein